MVSLVSLAVLGFIAYQAIQYYRALAKHIAEAKQSGLPYVVTPIYTFNRFWLVTHRLWLPLLKKLPTSWTNPWIIFLDPDWAWLQKFDAFQLMGSDVILVVAPGQNSIFVAGADANSQICSRRTDFPKPIELYGSVDVFGKNVVSTEGSVWRHHRKITSPPFTEKNNHMVWTESLQQGQSMLASWVGKQGGKPVTLRDVAADTMRVSLHVISRAGFGVHLTWPHEDEESGAEQTLRNGHTMSYKDALQTLLEHIIEVMLLPKWFLSRSPLQANKKALQSFTEWKQYMEEMYQDKKNQVRSGKTTEGMDLMGALIKGSGMTTESLNSADPEKAGQLLSDQEILGNAFVFILAGHETAANTIHFSMLYLAMNPSSQRRMQKDIDDTFGGQDPSKWDYDRDVPKLFGNMVGAVMNEELRLIAPVVGIPKSTAKGSPQPLTVGGKRIIIPGNCAVTLDTAATHRNPKYWPTMCGPNANDEEIKKDLNSFKPERWIIDPSKANTTTHTTHDEHNDEDDIGGPQSADTATTLLHPPRGAYIPFSEGYRACLGRRFAQVEVLAVLAVLFQKYSVELATDDFAADEEMEGMDEGGKEKVWTKARDRAEYLLQNGMGTIITIQLRGEKVPLRIVRRGEERFRDY